MMSRARYLKQLEREVETSRQIINDLTQENYHLRSLVTQAAETRQQYPQRVKQPHTA